jgi:hypothetical protein
MNHRVLLPNSNKAFKYNDLQKPNLVNFHLDDHRVLLRHFYPSTDNCQFRRINVVIWKYLILLNTGEITKKFEKTKVVIGIRKPKRTDNTMAKRKSTNNDLQNITQKTKDRAVRGSTYKMAPNRHGRGKRKRKSRNTSSSTKKNKPNNTVDESSRTITKQ